MLEELKELVCYGNRSLKNCGLVKLTWGNLSAIDRPSGLVVIKPSGVDYDEMKPADMVVINLSGEVVEGALRPSSDALTHIALYRRFGDINSVAHTHSAYATAWAQAGRGIPVYGTTHADVFFGEIPCTRQLTKEETETEYELNTGKVIAETFKEESGLKIPAAIVKNHGAFIWGETVAKTVENAVTLEEVAKIALFTEVLASKPATTPEYLVKKHFYRKHGASATYGQKK